MSTTDPLSPLRHRAFRHALEDGAADLVLGFYTLIVGGATQRRAFFALAVVYLGIMRLGGRGLHHWISSRRTGYAELPVDPPSGLLASILAAGVLTIGVVAGFTFLGGRLWSLDHWPTWTPLPAGIVLAGGFLHLATWSRLVRYYALSALSVGASVWFWLFPFGPRINPSDRLTLFLFLMAAALLLTGVLAMWQFRRHHPVVATEAGDVR